MWSAKGFVHMSSALVACTRQQLRSKLSLISVSQYARAITTTPFPEFANIPNVKSHEDLHKFSLDNPDLFWGKLAESRLVWNEKFDKVSDCDMTNGQIRWFLNGKINASVNCLDRHLKDKGENVALIWEKDEPRKQEFITYRELYKMVNKMANVLKQHGVKEGDRIVIYLPQSPVAVAAMLASTRIGALHTVVFAGFSAEALAGRILDAQAESIITADQGIRGGKIIELKKTVDLAVEKCHSVKKVFVYKRTGGDVPMGKIDIPLDKEMNEAPGECEPVAMDSNDTMFLLYTSGSTGKPKGISHSTGGYMTYTNVTFKHVFDYKDGEIFGCMADIGWITGHSYVVYGPLSNGATTLLFESTPTYPNPGRYWETTERLKLNHIYLSPTALRLLLKTGDVWVHKYDRSTLRKLGCVGEPLNSEAWEWYNSVVGEKRCDIIDTWWQTETGGICISPRPSSPGAEIRPAMPMRPFFGIDLALVNEKGEVQNGDNARGALCICKPWPGIATTIYGDHQRFIDTYFKTYPGMYLTGDGAQRKDSYYQITGRMDDVLNVTGHRLGTAEIENILDDHPATAESAVVGFPHEIKGEGVYAYIVLKDGVTTPFSTLDEQMKSMVKRCIASYAVPDVFQYTPGLPKTRSGKIMRRILRKVAANEMDQLGDISTLADPDIVKTIVKHSKKAKAACQKK